MPQAKKTNPLLWIALAIGGYFLYKKYSGAGQAVTALAPAASADTQKLDYLHAWDKGYGLSSPEYGAMESALAQMSSAEIDSMYQAVSTYFGTNAPLPQPLMGQIDAIAKKYHVFGQ